MNLKITWVAVLIGLASLAGCSGSTTTPNVLANSPNSTTSTPTTKTVNGVVADGYLEKANVCLDLNDNKKCDNGEQTILTAADGSYSLTNVKADDLKKHAIIVEVGAGPTGAINHEGNTATPVAKAYILSTPPDAPKTADGKVFISPLTTLIHNQMESDPTLNVVEAEKNVKRSLGAATATNLFEDFVIKKGASTEYDRISMVAQVVATAIGTNMEAIKTAAPGTDLKIIINMIATQVVNQLQAIATRLPTDSTGFDPASIVVVDVKTSGVEFDNALSQASTPVAISSIKEALGVTGFSSFSTEGSYSNFIIQETVKLGALLADGSYALTSTSQRKMTGAAWEINPTVVMNYRPTVDGWKLIGDKPEDGTIVFNTDNSAVWTLKGNGDSQKIQVTQLDIAGKFISPFTFDFMRNFQNIMVDSTAKFSPGSAAYKMTMTPLQDQYIIANNFSNSIGFTSINAVIQSLAVSKLPIGNMGYDSVQMTLGTASTAIRGDLQLFSMASMGQPILASGSTWEKKIVKNQEILIIHIPSIFRTVSKNPNAPDGNPDEDFIYGLANNTTVMKGSVRYANIPRQEKGFNFNTVAFNDMLSKFLLGV